MKPSDLFFNTLRLPVDFIMILLAGLTTYLLRTEILSAFRPVYFEFNLPLIHFMYLVLGVALLLIALYAISGLYSMRSRMSFMQECARVVIASSAGILLVIIYIFLRQELFNSRFLILGGWLFGIVFVWIGRALVRWVESIAVGRYNFGIHQLILIGNDAIAHQIRNEVTANPASGLRLVQHLLEPDLNKIKQLYNDRGVDQIVLASPHYPAHNILGLVEFCHEHHIVFKFVPNLYQTLTANVGMDMVSGVPVLELKRTPLEGWGKVAKRSLDIIFAITGLIITSPIFLILSILIPFDSPGPILLRQKRVSGKREFVLFKFRSMVRNAEELLPTLISQNDRVASGPLWKMKNDPRVTRIARIIRKFRIDEIPQFINVLKGDISLVGPRPHLPQEVAQYQTHHKKVLAIKAGATGLAQVSGASDLPFEQEVAYDSYYVEHWSLFLDMKIIFKTFFKMLRDKSAV